MGSRKKTFQIGDTIGEYRLTAKCGKGGFGQVFLAENTISGHLVALKILFDVKAETKELDGLKAFQGCRNEHLIQVHHIGKTDNGCLYYTMDRADNAGTESRYEADSLDWRIKKGKLLPEEVFELAVHLAEALGTLHDAGLIHRDIKPANIIYVEGKPVLADIGLVTNSERQDVSFAGTPGFLPKYVYYGGHSPCRESDFYALGMVLWCALTGHCDPEEARTANGSMTLRGHSGDLQRLCMTIQDEQDYDKITIHSSKDFLDCLNSEKDSLPSSKRSRGISTRKSKQKTYQNLLDEFYEEDAFTAPNIPEKKLKNALRSFAPGVNPKDVLLLVDDTVFGSAKDGLIVTKDALYGKEMWERPKKIRLFNNTRISIKDSKTLCCSNYEFISMTQQHEYQKIVAIIRAICASHSDSSAGANKPELLPKRMSGCLKFIIIFSLFWILLGIIGNLLDEENTDSNDKEKRTQQQASP